MGDNTQDTPTDATAETTIAKAERTYDGVLKRYDLPREEALKRLAEIKKVTKGKSKLYFKFTCGGCGARCMFPTPNALYEIGICSDCGHETDVTQAGFMVVTDFARRTPAPNAPQANAQTNDLNSKDDDPLDAGTNDSLP